MRTSATGRRNSCRRASGFTLLEILVVLVIIATMAGLLVFSFHDSAERKLQREADTLAALLNAVVDEAVMRGVELGLVIDGDGYRFVFFDAEKKQWQPSPERSLARHDFEQSYTIEFALDGEHLDERTLARVKLFAGRGEEDRLRPSLLILSSGEITPFTLTLGIDEDHKISLGGDGVNPVSVKRG